jgi:hypothetical protein
LVVHKKMMYLELAEKYFAFIQSMIMVYLIFIHTC